jgi:hypothetical protein
MTSQTVRILTDALIGGNRRIYLRGTTARINVAPTVRHDRAGAVIGVSW